MEIIFFEKYAQIRLLFLLLSEVEGPKLPDY